MISLIQAVAVREVNLHGQPHDRSCASHDIYLINLAACKLWEKKCYFWCTSLHSLNVTTSWSTFKMLRKYILIMMLWRIWSPLPKVIFLDASWSSISFDEVVGVKDKGLHDEQLHRRLGMTDQALSSSVSLVKTPMIDDWGSSLLPCMKVSVDQRILGSSPPRNFESKIICN